MSNEHAHPVRATWDGPRIRRAFELSDAGPFREESAHRLALHLRNTRGWGMSTDLDSRRSALRDTTPEQLVDWLLDIHRVLFGGYAESMPVPSPTAAVNGTEGGGLSVSPDQVDKRALLVKALFAARRVAVGTGDGGEESLTHAGVLVTGALGLIHPFFNGSGRVGRVAGYGIAAGFDDQNPRRVVQLLSSAAESLWGPNMRRVVAELVSFLGHEIGIDTVGLRGMTFVNERPLLDRIGTAGPPNPEVTSDMMLATLALGSRGLPVVWGFAQQHGLVAAYSSVSDGILHMDIGGIAEEVSRSTDLQHDLAQRDRSSRSRIVELFIESMQDYPAYRQGVGRDAHRRDRNRWRFDVCHTARTSHTEAVQRFAKAFSGRGIR